MRLTRNLVVVLFAAALLPASAFAERTLRYTDHEPLGGMRTKFIKEVFFAAIEKESHGRLKIDAHWDGELSSSYDALRTVRDGRVADMAIVVPEYAPNDLPLHQVFKGFPTGPTGDKQVAFFQRAYAEIPALPAELKKNKVVNVLFGTGYPVAFFSTKPLNTLADIKGSKWRTASFWHQAFLQNTGATSVSMPWGDGIFKALQAGTLDGLMVNVDSGYMLNVHRAAPNVLLSKRLWLGHVYLLVMNENTWNGLSKADQAAIQRAAQTAYKTLGALMDSSFDAMVTDMRKEGVKVRILDDQELATWQAASRYREVQAAWVKEQQDKGVKDAAPVLEKVSVLLGKM